MFRGRGYSAFFLIAFFSPRLLLFFPCVFLQVFCGVPFLRVAFDYDFCILCSAFANGLFWLDFPFPFILHPFETQ